MSLNNLCAYVCACKQSLAELANLFHAQFILKIILKLSFLLTLTYILHIIVHISTGTVYIITLYQEIDN